MDATDTISTMSMPAAFACFDGAVFTLRDMVEPEGSGSVDWTPGAGGTA